MRRVVLLLSLVAMVSVLGPQPAQAQQDGECSFILGFATLHEMIPNIVGDCVTNKMHNPENGDGLQFTTNGLLVWRKADNWTAFTNGYMTWVNGPFGLQSRLNSQRFSWEANPERLEIVPAPVPGEQCHTSGLSLRLDGMDAGAGNVVATFSFTNETDLSCTFYGYPGAQLLDAEGNALPTEVVRGGGFLSNQPGPSLVTVPAGGSAIFRMHWGQVEVGDEMTCPTSSQLAVTPPDEYSPLIIPAQIRACSGGRLNVSAVQPGA